MVIKCRITNDKQIEVNGYISCQGIGVKGPVVFVVDTGSSVTSLGHKDAMSIGVKVDRLNPSHENVAGIGGFAVSYELTDVDVILEEGNEGICRLPTVFYHRPAKKKKTKTKGPMRYERERVSASPSILGMDAIAKMGLVLETDAATYAILRRRP